MKILFLLSTFLFASIAYSNVELFRLRNIDLNQNLSQRQRIQSTEYALVLVNYEENEVELWVEGIKFRDKDHYGDIQNVYQVDLAITEIKEESSDPCNIKTIIAEKEEFAFPNYGIRQHIVIKDHQWSDCELPTGSIQAIYTESWENKSENIGVEETSYFYQ